jgi:hypothetical protein
VAGGIIAKMPPSWTDFATTLKHKRQGFSVAELIGSLDVEETARAKDTHGKEVETFSANMYKRRTSMCHKIIKRTSNRMPRSPSSQSRLKRTNELVALSVGVLTTGKALIQTANLSKRKNHLKIRKKQT